MDVHARLRTRARVATLAAAFVLAVGIVSVPAFPAAAAPATHLIVTTSLSAHATAGVSFDITVTAYDDTPEVDTSYSGTIRFSGGGDGATLPADSPITEGTGTVTLPATLEESGPQTITATDIAIPSFTDGVDVTVDAAAPASIAFVDPPGDGTYVNKNAGPVSVEVLDSFSNRTTSDATVNLSVDGSSNGIGSLSNTSAIAADGLATFNPISLDSDGQYTLLAQSSPSDAVVSTPLQTTSASFAVLPWADLQLSLTSDETGTIGEDIGQVVAGEQVTYHVLVENYGPSMNSSYDLSLVAPAGVLAANSLPADCSGVGTHIVSCTRNGVDGPTGEIPGSDLFDVVFNVPSSFADNAELITTGSIEDSNPTQLDGLKPDQDIPDTRIVTTRADLSPSLTTDATPRIAGAGAGYDYSLAVHNAGPSDNTGGYSASFTLPSGVTFVGADSSGECSAAGSVVTCADSTGIVRGPTDEIYTIHAQIAASKPIGAYSSTATVASDGTTDPALANNGPSAAATVNVITRANLSITKTAVAQLGGAAHDLAYANGSATQSQVTFTIGVTNATASATGPSDAQSVSVTDIIPTGTTFVSASPAADCSGTTTVTCTTLTPLTPGASRTYTIVVSVNAGLTGGEASNNFTNTATLTSPTKDITTNAATSKSATSETIRVHTVPEAPTDEKVDPGNGNAFVQWKQNLSADGGESIDHFIVSAIGGATPKVVTVGTGETCGTESSGIYCAEVTGLQVDSVTYAFEVRAENEVGQSTAISKTGKPSVHNSAKQINNNLLSQNTGNSSLPSSGDTMVGVQTFKRDTTGVGFLSETSDGGSFCGGAGCIGGKVLINRLDDPNLPAGMYIVELLYYKTLIKGTGVKYVAYYQGSLDNSSRSLLPCPKNPATATQPCSVIKLGSAGANPLLRILIYTDDADPTTGGRILK